MKRFRWMVAFAMACALMMSLLPAGALAAEGAYVTDEAGIRAALADPEVETIYFHGNISGLTGDLTIPADKVLYVQRGASLDAGVFSVAVIGRLYNYGTFMAGSTITLSGAGILANYGRLEGNITHVPGTRFTNCGTYIGTESGNGSSTDARDQYVMVFDATGGAGMSCIYVANTTASGVADLQAIYPTLPPAPVPLDPRNAFLGWYDEGGTLLSAPIYPTQPGAANAGWHYGQWGALLSGTQALDFGTGGPSQAPAAQTVEVSAIASASVAAEVTATLSGPGQDSYLLNGLAQRSVTYTVMPGADVSLSVAPRDGLVDGAHDATLTITGDYQGVAVPVNGGALSVPVTYEVGTLPSAPTNVRAFAGDGEVVLLWEAPQDPGTPAYTRYEVSTDGQNWQWLTATSLWHAFPGPNGVPMTLWVRAAGLAGEGPAVTVTQTPMESPGIGLTPGSLAFGTIALGEAVPVGQTVTIENTDAFRDMEIRDVTLLDAGIAYHMSGLQLPETVSPGGTAVLHVTPSDVLGQAVGVYDNAVLIDYAFDTMGYQAMVPVTFAVRAGVPGMVRDLTAHTRDGGLLLRWVAPATDGGAAISTYAVSVDNGQTWTMTGSAGTEYLLSGLVNGQTYTVLVRAHNVEGAGPHAGVVGTPSQVASLTASPGSVDFGEVLLASGAPSRQVTLVNDGTVAVTVTSVTVGAPFVVEGSAVPVTLEPGGTARMLVRVEGAALAQTGTYLSDVMVGYSVANGETGSLAVPVSLGVKDLERGGYGQHTYRLVDPGDMDMGDAGYVYVTSGGTPLYDGPGTEHDAKGVLASGTSFYVIDWSADGTWCYVRTTSGEEGWVQLPYVGTW